MESESAHKGIKLMMRNIRIHNIGIYIFFFLLLLCH